MRNLIESIQKSIYGPEYYCTLSGGRFAPAFKYFSALALLVTLVLTIFISIPIVIRVPEFLHKGAAALVSYYPKELEIKVTNGIVSTNVAEPYRLPLPAALRDSREMNASTSLAVIDTSADFSMDRYAEYDAFVWVGKNFIAIPDSDGGIKVQPFDKNVNVNINKPLVGGVVEMAKPYFRFVAPLLVIILFLGFLAMTFAELLYLLVAALLIWLLLYFLRHRVSYGGAYRIGLHAITLPLILNSILLLFGLQLTQLPFLQTLVLLTVVYLNFYQQKSVLPQSAVSVEPQRSEGGEGGTPTV